MPTLRTQVVIIGAGPSGLLLSLLLQRYGIDSIVLERRTRARVESRIRAGLLEWGTVEVLAEAGVGEHVRRDGLVHEGLELAFGDRSHRIDLKRLAGRCVVVYGQTEIQKDLCELRADAGGVLWEASEVSLSELDGSHPLVSYVHRGVRHEIRCDFVAGCDGFHGVSRASIPERAIRLYEREYPFGWLGVLADVPPVHHELIYANDAQGFALCSMRSRTRSRYYVQCPVTDTIEQWPDQRFWSVFSARLPEQHRSHLVPGPALEKSIVPLRSFVAEPLRFGRLFLVGDAGHIVPPTGAKGLNLAVADVRVLSRALCDYYTSQSQTLLDEYSQRCLDRVWKATRFSWWFTQLMHKFSDDPFAHRLQLAELRYLTESEAASRALAENYVGLGFTM